MKAATFSAVADGGTPAGRDRCDVSEVVEFGLGRAVTRNGHSRVRAAAPGAKMFHLRQVRASLRIEQYDIGDQRAIDLPVDRPSTVAPGGAFSSLYCNASGASCSSVCTRLRRA